MWRTARTILILTVCLAVLLMPRAAGATPGRAFASTDKIVAAYVFHWYGVGIGQTQSVWHPVEGRNNWDGSVAFWQRQVKDMMDAGIDVLYVHLIPNYEPQRVNLFTALRQLRDAGYKVPQVAPFLDPAITFDPIYLGPVDLCTTAGKDVFVGQYVRFFNQYRAANNDLEGDSYLATVDGHPVLNTWALGANLNPGCLTRQDVTSRLAASLGSLFGNGIYMVAISASGITWADEANRVFVGNYGGSAYLIDGISATVKPGQWDPSIDVAPGRFLARSGGTAYSNAWTAINGNPALKRVHIESWNEYVEGTGLYEADPSQAYWQLEEYPQRSDTWGATARNYIDTTAQKAAAFNNVADLDARFLDAALPAQMEPGEKATATITVRNEGDAQWRASTGFKLNVSWGNGTVQSFPLVDSQNEVDQRADPLFAGKGGYGGVFRGRPVTFQVSITAPATAGTYSPVLQMAQGATAFGLTLAKPIKVMTCEAPFTATTVYATLGIAAYGDNYFCGNLGDLQRTADFICTQKGKIGALSFTIAAKPPGSYCAYKTPADTPNWGLTGNLGHGTHVITQGVCNACGANVIPTTVYATIGNPAYGDNYFCGDLGDPQATASFVCKEKGYVGGAVTYRIAAKPAGSYCAYKTPLDTPNAGLLGNFGHNTQVLSEIQCTNHVP
jgi:hypothetical protein